MKPNPVLKRLINLAGGLAGSQGRISLSRRDWDYLNRLVVPNADGETKSILSTVEEQPRCVKLPADGFCFLVVKAVNRLKQPSASPVKSPDPSSPKDTGSDEKKASEPDPKAAKPKAAKPDADKPEETETK